MFIVQRGSSVFEKLLRMLSHDCISVLICFHSDSQIFPSSKSDDISHLYRLSCSTLFTVQIFYYVLNVISNSFKLWNCSHSLKLWNCYHSLKEWKCYPASLSTLTKLGFKFETWFYNKLVKTKLVKNLIYQQVFFFPWPWMKFTVTNGKVQIRLTHLYFFGEVHILLDHHSYHILSS